MKKIGRPRKAVTKKNISVNLPSHVIDRVNDAISWKQSRSIWIEDAIINRLDSKTPDIEEIPLLTLLWEAKNRDDCDPNIKFVIQTYLDSTASNP
jgi:metal-responsive CopG/Arc/MetJ family transcriptional regulator